MIEVGDVVTFEEVDVGVDVVLFAVVGLFDVARKIDESINRSINPEHNCHVERDTEDQVASEVVHEHVVGHCNLVLSAHEIEDGDGWDGKVHSERHLGHHYPCRGPKDESEYGGFACEGWQNHQS